MPSILALTSCGAVPVRPSVYLLPAGEETAEDFAWLRRELVAEGGDAVVVAASFVIGLTDAEARGLEINGVMHSHTHTDAYPSPTDLAQAPDPAWHYVIVSLRDPSPVLRSFLLDGRTIREERVRISRA